MPRLDSDQPMESHGVTGSNFTFQATRISDLGATEYTLVTIAVDVTSSTYHFADELRQMLVTAVQACQRSPRSNNLLLRVILFSTSIGGVQELHGFKPLVDINTANYPVFQPEGLTPLSDAVYSGLVAMLDYGRQLADNDFLANGIAIIITDGGENASATTPAMIKHQLESARQEEQLESLLSILVGINAGQLQDVLNRFKLDAGLDQYIDAGEATPGRLAKLADFVSQSVSSQSQALGTGGPSQAVSATI